MHHRLRIIAISILLTLSLFTPASATVYFSWDSENQACDAPFPFYYQNYRGYTKCGISVPQGSKALEWSIGARPNDAYSEITNTQSFPTAAVLGRTYYLAFFVNFTRINGADIWREFSGQSFDKLVDLRGNGVRWTISVGQHESYCANQNQDHRFTAWISNASYHLTPSIECVDNIHANIAPFHAKVSPIQLQYESWNRIVLAVKFASDSTGSVTLWVNGNKIIEHLNIRTVANSSPSLADIILNGTIAQPAYDAPAHYRRFDAIILTDNWQDIVNGGYMSGSTPPAGGTISPPSGLKIVSGN